MITLEDAEIYAARELQRAELDGHDAPHWHVLLSRRDVLVAEFGQGSPIRGDGTHGLVKDQAVVYVREHLSERARAFVALHEYAHSIVEREHLRLACRLERWCNRFAAAVLCPSPVVRRAWRDGGADLLSAYERCPALGSTAFSLRLGEVGVAAVRVFDGNTERYAEPTPLASNDRFRPLVRLARADGYAESEGVRAWRLPNAPQRVAVLMDCAA